MESKDLPSIILMLVLVGLLIGVGVLIADKFATQVTDDLAITTSVAVAGVSIKSGTLSPVGNEVLSVSSFGNATYGCSSCALSGSGCCNYTTTGTIKINASFPNATYPVTYTYNADSTSTDVMQSVRDTIADIAKTWLGLIIVIIVMSIIIFMIVKSFSGQGR